MARGSPGAAPVALALAGRRLTAASRCGAADVAGSAESSSDVLSWLWFVGLSALGLAFTRPHLLWHLGEGAISPTSSSEVSSRLGRLAMAAPRRGYGGGVQAGGEGAPGGAPSRARLAGESCRPTTRFAWQWTPLTAPARWQHPLRLHPSTVTDNGAFGATAGGFSAAPHANQALRLLRLARATRTGGPA